LVKATPSWDAPTPRALGVDEFAFRKGHRYGTTLVDLELRRPIDLLPDRSAESLAKWLQAHPGMEVIARDRSAVYAEGARAVAPDALQG
jgi:transposase